MICAISVTAVEFRIPARREYHDPLFDEALIMWQNYNSESTDIVKLHSLLEQSVQQFENPDAMAKLGEFWLFGLPVAQKFPLDEELPEFIERTEDGIKFKRDYEMAIWCFE